MPVIPPLVILAIGIATVIGLILVLRTNAFLALIAAAMLVSLLAPGDLSAKFERVAVEFGNTCGKIGIVIALAAIIGQCMMDSGAADRVVRAFLGALGEKRASWALAGSGYVLSIPVFFDTVFYLLVPLARSLFKRTNRDFLKYVLAIAAGGVATHTLVPPTPGPLTMAANLNIDLGWMIVVGVMVAIPATIVGVAAGAVINRRMPIPLRPISAEPEPPPLEDSQLPPLFWSLLPIILPVVLISASTVANTVTKALAESPEASAESLTAWQDIAQWASLFGNANFALFLSAIVAMAVLVRKRGLTLRGLGKVVEYALMSGGVIILITAAGGAFGRMLYEAKVGDAIKEQFGGESAGGTTLILLAFAVSAILKVAQGSGTVAMITTSGMFAAMIPSEGLSFNTAYLATAIGGGSLVVSWMNDSGFWIVAKMSGLTETETLKSWTVVVAIVGVTTLVVTLVLANVLPLTDAIQVQSSP